MDLIQQEEVVFAIGPAGTGKTYLAMSMAIQAFKSGEVSPDHPDASGDRGGGKTGFFCRGDLQSKIDPYLRPLYDALYQINGGRKLPAQF